MSAKPWDVVVAGECMVARPFSMHDDERFRAVIELLRQSDVTYAHLETSIGEYEEMGPAKSGDWIGSYLLAEPAIADELKWAGIDILSLASNHSVDFGAPGIEATIRHLKRAGLAAAGIGGDLERAREPAYVETRRGRIALVSMSTGNKAYEWAGLAKGSLPPRAGVNPLRVKTTFTVDAAAAASLKDIGRRLGILRDASNRLPGMDGAEFRLTMPHDQSSRVASVFVEGKDFATVNVCEERDLEGNRRSVSEARHMADLVLVAHHFNISEGARGDAPPSFARVAARAAIDAGADVYIGHGWHKTLGIEIYKGKPILYGVGNFFAQSEFIRRVPYDSYEAWGHDVDRLGTLTPEAHPLHPGLDGPSRNWWSSAVIKLELTEGKLTGLTLHPVEMGREVSAEAPIRRRTGKGSHALTEGRPLLAGKADAERVIERYQRLSQPLGTIIENKDGIGILRL